MGNSKIEWTEMTWNPIVGCSIVSPGCTNCYAMRDAWRKNTHPKMPHYHGLTKQVNGHAVWTGKLALAPESILLAPLRRKKPTVYFVNSMGDLFHEDCPDEWIDRIFAVMALCPQHTFQVLTKRAARMWEYMIAPDRFNAVLNMRGRIVGAWDSTIGYDWPPRNVWLGVSAERQQEADERIPHLLKTPAAVRFVSAEPLLGSIDMHLWMRTYPAIDWVIVGGESGPGARPMHPDWARGLRKQCFEAGVPFFFKQWGAWAPSTPERAAGNPRSGWQASASYSHVAKAHELYPEAGAAFVEHMGKHAAGRVLDGATHDAMPALHHAT